MTDAGTVDIMPALEIVAGEASENRLGTFSRPLPPGHSILREPEKMQEGRSYWIQFPDGQKIKVRRVGTRVLADT